MDAKSSSATDFLDKVRDVTEALKDEFNLTNNPSENDYINTGPPPNMKRRKLIFDSMRSIIDQDSTTSGGDSGGGNGSGEDRGRYVYVFGAGYHGQLGRKAARGHKKYANIPIGVHLPTSIAVREIACGALHTGVVTDDGLVYTWGDGRMGQLGHLQEGFSNQPVPTLVSSLSGVNVTHLACGQNHTMCITSDGNLYAWGWSRFGQLGLGTRTNQRYPVQISDESFVNKTVVQISCGDRHSVAITNNGEIFTFGSGEHGQLGHGNNNDTYFPKKIESLHFTKIRQSSCGSIHTAIIDDDGKLYIFGFGENLYGKNNGNFNYEPILIPFRYAIKRVACGQSHVLILCTNGDVYAWGDGSYGEIGQGAFKASQQPRLVLLNKNIASIACGRYHSSAVTNNGSLYTWGCGDNGQLARPQNMNSDNTMINIKKANSIPKLVISLLGNVVGEISCGEHHTCVLASCRYKNLSEDVFEYGKLEEIEFNAKLNLLSSSKQKGRGIAKKDLTKIKKWRKEEEQRIVKKKAHTQLSENKKIQQELSKISSRHDIILSSPKQQQKLLEEEDDEDAQNDDDEQSSMMSTEEEKKASEQKPLTSIIKQDNSSNNNNTSAGINGPDSNSNTNNNNNNVVVNMSNINNASNTGNNEKRISAKAANQNRASFHESTRNFLYGMASQIFGEANKSMLEAEKSRQSTEVLIKNKFSYRKEFDKLKLVTKMKENELRKLDEDLAMLQEVDDCSELASQEAEMQSRKLGMKLNTVMIKISEAERSKRTYELNIVHIKDESQENHKQLDSLRRNLFLQENLKKKITKFKDYALKQKNFALTGLKEFNAELAEWRNFLDFQYRNLAAAAKKDDEQHQNQKKDNKENAGSSSTNNKNDKKAKKQQKAMNRITKLKKLVDNNEKEIRKLAEKLANYEQEIDFFEDRFKRIYNATGLSETDKIINKFFVNAEIKKEQNEVLQDLYEQRKSKEMQLVKAENKLKLLHNNNNDHSWRDIDILHEKLQKEQHTLQQEKVQQEKIYLEMVLLKEWMNVIINNLLKYLKQYEIDEQLQQIQKQMQISSDAQPKQLVEVLYKYIEILLNITDDIQTGTFAFKQKANYQPMQVHQNQQSVVNQAAVDVVGSSNKAASKNKKNSKSRKAKHAK